MSEKNISCLRYIENFNPPHITTKLVHKVCECATDAFLAQIEYGKDYVISTDLVKEDWADGFGTKYTYTIRFDDLVRCKDCDYQDCCDHRDSSLNGFCAWGERKEDR